MPSTPTGALCPVHPRVLHGRDTHGCYMAGIHRVVYAGYTPLGTYAGYTLLGTPTTLPARASSNMDHGVPSAPPR